MTALGVLCGAYGLLHYTTFDDVCQWFEDAITQEAKGVS